MSPLYRGEIYIALLPPLICSSHQFCVCALSPSIMQVVRHGTYTQCRAIVGPPSTTLSKHLPSIGLPCRVWRHVRWMWAGITDGGPALTQLWFKASWPYCQPFVFMWLMIVPTGSKRLPGVGTVLAHSLRRWIGVVPALGGCISCFVVMTMGLLHSGHDALAWCWFGAGPAS